MSSYTVTRLIRSAIHLSEACDIQGVHFDPIVPFESDRALASAVVSADYYQDASRLFDQHLLLVVDALTITTGAALAPLGGSTLIEKRRSKYVYLHALERREAASLTVFPGRRPGLFDGVERAVELFRSDHHAGNTAHYLRQAALTEHVLTAAMHALQAAESYTVIGETRHPRLREVMGDDLYAYFYDRMPELGDNRRNALFHGRRIPEEGVRSRIGDLQERLLTQLREQLGSAPSGVTLSPVRGFVSYDTHAMFLEANQRPLDLVALVDAAAHGQLHSATEPRWIGGRTARRLLSRW